MGRTINLSDEQLQAIREFWEARLDGSMTTKDGEEFIQGHNLPWNSVPAFRLWSKENGYVAGREAKVGTGEGGSSRATGVSLAGIRKFGGPSEATNIADLLLEDPSKAISGAIEKLQKECDEIDLAAEQQIQRIKSEADNAKKERIERLRKLQELIPER